MLTLMSRIPEMSDIIITVFSARRRGALDERDGSLQLIGEDETAMCFESLSLPVVTAYLIARGAAKSGSRDDGAGLLQLRLGSPP